MLKELIDTFEELKKYVYIIDRGTRGKIIIKFTNDKFYHLVGLHKTNINMFIPEKIVSKDKKYKYLKKNVDRFNNILKNQIKEKDSLELRIISFHNIIDLLDNNKSKMLYDLRQKTPGSMYDGDYGLLKIFEDLNCLLGLKSETKLNDIIYCAPQSWMSSTRVNKLVENRKVIYMKDITKIPINLFNEDYIKEPVA